MKKYLLIIAYGLVTFVPSYSMQTSHPLNIVLIFKPSYETIFAGKQKISPIKMQAWNAAIEKIRNFVMQNSGGNQDILTAWDITEKTAQQMINTLDYLRNVVGYLKTVKNQREKMEYKRTIENQLNEMLNMFYIAKDMTKTQFKNINQENARRAVEGTARYMESALMTELWEELAKT